MSFNMNQALIGGAAIDAENSPWPASTMKQAKVWHLHERDVEQAVYLCICVASSCIERLCFDVEST